MRGANDYSSRFRDPIWSWIILVIIGYLAGSFVAAFYGVDRNGVIGVFTGFGLIVLRLIWVGFRSIRNGQKLRQRQKTIHDMDQEAVALEAELARRKGVFDKWEKNT